MSTRRARKARTISIRTAAATDAYQKAVAKAGFRLYTGPDASAQPAEIGDILLHETAVACFKKALSKKTPEVPAWQETRDHFARRVKAVVRECNANYNFRLLCCEYLERLRLLVEREGDRLRK